MKTNKLDAIKVQKSGHPRAKFNLSHDVNTTCGFGEIQPLMCRFSVPGTKHVLDIESLVRCAPMPAPTFGRVSYKTWSSFVNLSALFPNAKNMFAQTKAYAMGDLRIYQELPHMPLWILSSRVLCGALCTAYKYGSYDKGKFFNVRLFKCTKDEYAANKNGVKDFVDSLWSTNSVFTDDSSLNFAGAQYSLNLGAFMPNEQNNTYPNSTLWTHIPLANSSPVSFVYEKVENKFDQIQTTVTEGDYVSIDAADVLIPLQQYNIVLAFRLSDYGRRFRKFLLGCGYQVNLQTTEHVSIVPLLAAYKAYFDDFGLCLYSNWNETYCYKFCNLWDNYFKFGDSSYSEGGDLAQFFIKELPNCFYTDDYDFVSAHLDTLSVSPFFRGLDRIVDVQSAPSNTIGNVGEAIYQHESHNVASNSQAQISRVEHSELDAELLKKLYLWTNKNTIAGKRIASLLRAQGLGRWMELQTPSFVGSTSVNITISDVVSTSNTESTGGSFLGEYGGRGLEYDKSKTFVYENDEVGFFVTLACVVPQAGYYQGVDPSLKCYKMDEMYQPEFDGKGFECTEKLNVFGVCECPDNYSLADRKNLYTDVFGFIPRYSGLKVASNVANGDFSLRGTRSQYLPYMLDKVLNVNDYYIEKAVDSEEFFAANFSRTFPISDLPTSGVVWRYPTRYPWLGNFNRMFINTGKNQLPEKYNEFSSCVFDNFLVHNVLNYVQFAPMKPIESSYGTYDEDGNKGTIDVKRE